MFGVVGRSRVWLYNYVQRRVLFSCTTGAPTFGLAGCLPGVRLLLVTSSEGLHVVNTLLGSVVQTIRAEHCSGVAVWLSSSRCAVAVGRTLAVYYIGE